MAASNSGEYDQELIPIYSKHFDLKLFESRTGIDPPRVSSVETRTKATAIIYTMIEKDGKLVKVSPVFKHVKHVTRGVRCEHSVGDEKRTLETANGFSLTIPMTTYEENLEPTFHQQRLMDVYDAIRRAIIRDLEMYSTDYDNTIVQRIIGGQSLEKIVLPIYSQVPLRKGVPPPAVRDYFLRASIGSRKRKDGHREISIPVIGPEDKSLDPMILLPTELNVEGSEVSGAVSRLKSWGEITPVVNVSRVDMSTWDSKERIVRFQTQMVQCVFVHKPSYIEKNTRIFVTYGDKDDDDSNSVESDSSSDETSD